MDYIIENEDFAILRELNKLLFGDGSHMTADQRRDIANTMHVVLNRIEKNEIE